MMPSKSQITESAQGFLEALVQRPQDAAKHGEALSGALGVSTEWCEADRFTPAQALYKNAKRTFGKPTAQALRQPVFATFGVSAAAYDAQKMPVRVMQALLRSPDTLAVDFDGLRTAVPQALVLRSPDPVPATDGQIAIRVPGGAVFSLPLEAIEARPDTFLESWLSGRHGAPTRDGNTYVLESLQGDPRDFYVIADYYHGRLPDIHSTAQGRGLLRLADYMGLTDLSEHIAAEVYQLRRFSFVEIQSMQTVFFDICTLCRRELASSYVEEWLRDNLSKLAKTSAHVAFKAAVEAFCKRPEGLDDRQWATAQRQVIEPLRASLMEAFPAREEHSEAGRCLVNLAALAAYSDAEPILRKCAKGSVLDAHAEGYLVALHKVLVKWPDKFYYRGRTCSMSQDNREKLLTLRVNLTNLLYALGESRPTSAA